MSLLRVRHIAWKRISVEKPSLNKTDSHKTRRKIRICRYQVKKHLLRPISCVEHVVASQKQIADLKGPSLLRKLEKIRKWEKKTNISVTVTYLLISKAGSSESRSELSSMAELTRVQAKCQRCMKSLFNTRLLCGETGQFTRWARNRRSNARRFFSRSSPFYFWFILVRVLQTPKI